MPTPTDRKTVAVTHIYVVDLGRAWLHHTRRHIQKALDALIDLTAPKTHLWAIYQFQRPGTASVKTHRRDPQTALTKAGLHREKTLRHLTFSAGRTG